MMATTLGVSDERNVRNHRVSNKAGLPKDSFIQILIESYWGPNAVLGIGNPV